MLCLLLYEFREDSKLICFGYLNSMGRRYRWNNRKWPLPCSRTLQAKQSSPYQYLTPKTKSDCISSLSKLIFFIAWPSINAHHCNSCKPEFINKPTKTKETFKLAVNVLARAKKLIRNSIKKE